MKKMPVVARNPKRANSTGEKASLKKSKLDPANVKKVKSKTTITQQPPKPFNFVQAPKKLVARTQIQKGVSALFEYAEKTAKSDSLLFDDEKPIFLQITAVKVPKTPARISRLTIPHSLLSESSEICFIGSDVGKPKEHEETIEHYEDLFSKHGITNIKTILPYHQFKTEYGDQYELKRNLLGLYDLFLVDAKISSVVSKCLGKIFMEKRKIPTPIKVDVPHLKNHIESSIKKTYFKLHSNSDSFIVQAGHNKMEHEQILENIVEIIDQLESEFPGGEDNIRALSVKMDRSIAVPIYLTLRKKNDVQIPVIHRKRPKHFQDVTGELSTYLNKNVTVLPGGDVIVHELGDSSDEEGDIDEEDME